MRRRTIALAAVAAAGLWWWRGPAPAPTVEVEVHVKLAAGARATAAGPALTGGAIVAERPLFERPAAALAADRALALATSGEAVPDLTAWRVVTVRGSRAAIARSVARLEARPDVARAFVAPVLVPPTASGARRGSCPVRTPSYLEHQGYLGPAPGGVDVEAAWALPGGRGEAVRFADIEHAWDLGHEDLPGDRAEELDPPRRRAFGPEHGTAVLGEIAAVDNRLGMTGLAPDVERIVVASVSGRPAAAAIDRAQARLRPGDVLLLELQGMGPRNRYLPVEWWDDIYEAIRVATARGVVVVEAAGNGGEDLDHPRYRGVLSRGGRDSGAIVVGAGAPAAPGYTDRSRLDFSNHGTRVDVQGWGRMVATLAYGDLQGCAEDRRSYTARFSGTSSASPIVAGAALLLQSIAITRTGRPLSPAALRDLLVRTGTPQTSGPHGPASQHIGPRPDLRRALAALPR